MYNIITLICYAISPSHKSHVPGSNGPSPVVDDPLPFFGEYSSTAAEFPLTNCCCEDFIVTADAIA